MIVGGYEFPDTCPTDCEFIDDIADFGQSAVCVSCPVFCCGGDQPMVKPEEYRNDWAAIMHRTVVGKVRGVPALPLNRETQDEVKDNGPAD